MSGAAKVKRRAVHLAHQLDNAGREYVALRIVRSLVHTARDPQATARTLAQNVIEFGEATMARRQSGEHTPLQGDSHDHDSL